MSKRAEPHVLTVPPQPAKPPRSAAPIVMTSDKKAGKVSWRDVLSQITAQQNLRQERSWSQERGNVHIETDRPVCILTLSDTHIGSWATDYALFEQITRELIETPEFFVILLGDLINMAIKLRGVAEIHDDAIDAGGQYDLLESWLQDVGHKVICATWDNHAAEREEQVLGTSVMARILSRRVLYHKGIGHVDLTVGNQTYRLAVSHHFQGRSIYNPVHGAQRYLVLTDPEREIACCGDSHVPGMLTFTHGKETKLAINSGSIQTNSAYAKRFFSLTTHPVFPCFTLDPHEHRVVPYWSPSHYLASIR